MIYLSKERMPKHMSYNCAHLNKDAIIASDSRETFIDGTYKDNRQKTFVNREQKIIWSMTGLIKYRDVDIHQMINTIMNCDIVLSEELTLIENFMCFETQRYYDEFHSDVYFDFFIVENINNHNVLYVFEVKNGTVQMNNSYTYNNYISSGIITKYQKDIEEMVLLSRGNKVDLFQEILMSVEKESGLNDKTVGGPIYIATMNKYGEIKTYIDGEEKKF